MSFFVKLGLIFSFFFASLAHGFVPTVTFDAAAPGEAVSSRASGHLYGLAEAGVPDDLMADSLDISSVSQKVPDGLQHPTGDLDHVAGALGKADYLVTYLQDAYPTWYYAHGEILQARKDGTYDWRAFLRDDFFPRVTASVRTLAEKEYADRVVLCLFNECDNGLWFGETRTDGDGNVWGEFSAAGRDAFFAAWKETFDLVRETAPDLKIGGPGYCDYNADKEREFLSFCAANGCVPDVMIWHELGEFSGRLLPEHVAGYRTLEAELIGEALPVIVTEYGMMSECGNPGEMIRYVCGIETSGVYGNIAYWRLADNLNENAADANTPNACWWLYRWYADLEGRLLAQEKTDLFHADFAKAVREQRPLKYKTFYSLGCLNDEKDAVTVLCGACDYSGRVTVKNLSATALGKRVRVRVEEVQYAGLGGAVTKPTLLRDRDVAVRGGRVSVRIPDMREGAVYRISLTKATGENEPAAPRAARYEAEDGRLLGGAYTYRSAYAATGGDEKTPENLVGGMENPGDGVELTVRGLPAGDYDMDIVYGKHNDGDGPAGRVNGTAMLTVESRRGAASFALTLPNTIKSEYTARLRQRVTLGGGKNVIRFEHRDGTFVLDSVLLTPADDGARTTLALLPETELCGGGKTAYLAAAPADGYYTVFCDAPALTVDGAPAGAVAGSADVYLRRGLNLLELAGDGVPCAVSASVSPPAAAVRPREMALTAPAALNGAGDLTGIGSAGGAASFAFHAPAAGDYRVTLLYANNAEGGYHDYNVDLIEEYFTVTVNGESRTVMCRSTYSDETFSTVSFCVPLRAGENGIVLSNDGSVRFDGRETAAPTLRQVSLNPVRLK